MNDKVRNLKLDISVYQRQVRIEVFKGELPWVGDGRKQAQTSISLASVGIDNATVGISCSPGLMNTLGGFAIVSFSGNDQICCSFCCLPKSSQSLRVKIDSSIVEIMLTNSSDRV